MEKSHSNFVDSLRTDATKQAYQLALDQFKNWNRAKKYDDIAKLSISNAQDKIIRYIKHLRNNGLASRSIRMKLAAIRHFYVMNDVILNWPKLVKFIGEVRTITKDRIYTKDEIQKILEKCDERKRVMILLLVSTGIRIGALPSLAIGDIVKLTEQGVYRIKVYSGDSEEYISFTTPECAQAIDSYLDYRMRMGEIVKPDAPLIREQFDPRDANTPRRLTLAGIKTSLTKILLDSGVRIKGTRESQFKRQEVMRFHGFRKYFNTMLNQAGVKPAIKEMLLGHKVGLEASYLRPALDELLNEYLKAADLLTISEEKQLRRAVEKLQIENEQIATIRTRYQDIQLQIEEKERVNSDVIMNLSDQVARLSAEVERLRLKK